MSLKGCLHGMKEGREFFRKERSWCGRKFVRTEEMKEGKKEACKERRKEECLQRWKEGSL